MDNLFKIQLPWCLVTSSSSLSQSVYVVLPPRFEDHRFIVVQSALNQYAHDWNDKNDEHTDTILLKVNEFYLRCKCIMPSASTVLENLTSVSSARVDDTTSSRIKRMEGITTLSQSFWWNRSWIGISSSIVSDSCLSNRVVLNHRIHNNSNVAYSLRTTGKS